MKKVLITGSSRGIGAGIAREIGKNYEVILHGKGESSALNAIASELGAQKLVFDVANTAQCRAVLEDFTRENGALWGIVLNAGIALDNTFAAISESEWKSVIETNLNSFYNVLHPLISPYPVTKTRFNTCLHLRQLLAL